MRRTVALWVLWIPLSSVGAVEEPKPGADSSLVDGQEIRVLIPCGSRSKEGDKTPRDLFPSLLDSCLEAGGMKVVKWEKDEIDAAGLLGIKAIIFDSRSADFISHLSSGSMQAIEGAVKAGAGLVALGRGAGALSAQAPLSGLLFGRGRSSGQENPSLPEVLCLEFLDQSHPITQCVTNLVMTRCRATAEPGPNVTVLARASRAPPLGGSAAEKKPTPAFWLKEEGSGREVVLALELGPEADASDVASRHPRGKGREAPSVARENRALSFLAARATEWAATHAVTIQIPADMPLAAEHFHGLEPDAFPGARAVHGFYRGRQIAPVMGYQAASWLERPDRETTELPEKMLDSLGIQKGDAVADLGAGVGYLTVRMARRVGPTGKVVAVDLQEEMLKGLHERLAREGLKNVEAVLATETDPRLPEGSLDLVLMVDVYHELSRPEEVLSAVRRSLKLEGGSRRPGRLVLVEYRGEDPGVPIKPLHRTTVQQVRAELDGVGFQWIETKELLPQQHILVFGRK